MKKHVTFANWANVAEIISAFAIVVSLIYATTEYRRSLTLTNREVDAILFERTREENRAISEVEGLADIIIKAGSNSESLTPTERLRFIAFQHNFFDSWEMAWVYHQDGILDEDTWSEWDEWFKLQALRRPLFGWEENRENFPGELFQNHVDMSIRQSKAVGK